MSSSSDEVKAPYEWIKSWGTGDELISDESYGEEEMSGIEDLFWLWPHRDDIPQSVSHTVQMIVDLCKVLGREVATVAEAREITNVHRTS